MTIPDNPQRRDFLIGAGAAGFALAAQPVLAQQVITTGTAGLKAGSASASAPDGKAIPLYYARPDKKGNQSLVLVVSEIFGVHEHIRDVCRRFAHAGHFALAPELFVRQGDPATLGSVQDILDRVISRVPDAQVMGDLDACVSWAGGQGGDATRVHVTGFCWGGRVTWLYAAHRTGIRSGVAWYGRLDGVPGENTPVHPLDIVDQLKAPVLGLYGGKDQGIPNSDVDAMRDALRKSPAMPARASDIVVYPEAPHAFHADYRPSYRADDAADAWQRCLAWMSRHDR